MEGFQKGGASASEFSNAQLEETIETLKGFLGEIQCSEEVLKLALKKCKLDLEETICMVTSPDQINDLEEEVKKEQDALDQQQLMTN